MGVDEEEEEQFSLDSSLICSLWFSLWFSLSLFSLLDFSLRFLFLLDFSSPMSNFPLFFNNL